MALSDVYGPPAPSKDPDPSDPFFGDPGAIAGLGSANAIPPAVAPQPVTPAPAPPPASGLAGFLADRPLAPKPPPGTPLGGTGLLSSPPPAGPPAPALGVTAPQGPAGPPQGIGATPGAVLGAQSAGAPPENPISPAQALAIGAAGWGAPRPAGWSPSTRTVEGTQYAPGTIGAVGDYLGGQGDLAAAQLEFDRQHGANQGAANARLSALDEVDAAQEARVRQRQQADIEDHYQHLEKLQAAANEAGKVDPQRFWHNKSLGVRVGLAIGAALGGAGGALTHSENGALKIIQDAWDKDIDAQKAQAESARGEVTGARNLYELNLQKYGDADRAREATRLAQRQVTASQLQAKVDAQDAPAAAKLHALQLLQPIRKEEADIRRDIDEKTIKATTSERYREAGVPGGDPLAVLRRAAEARKLGGEIAGSDLATRKGEADLRKVTAETATEEAKAEQAKGGPLAAVGAPPESINPFQHPLNYLASLVPGSKTAIDRDAYQSAVIGAIHQANPGMRSPELLKELSHAYLPRTFDSDETLRFRAQELQQRLAHGAPAVGLPPGVTPEPTE